MQTSPDLEIERYLCSGEQDHMFSSWPGSDLFARAKHGRAALRGALISVVRSRTRHAVAPAALCTMDAVAFTRDDIRARAFAMMRVPPAHAVSRCERCCIHVPDARTFHAPF